jgi:hypothetical protein
MLSAGSEKVYFAKVWDDQLFDVFLKIMKLIPAGVPVICESPALRNFVEPGVFVIMTSEVINKHKDISSLKALPHVMLQYEDLDRIESLPLVFTDGGWFFR